MKLLMPLLAALCVAAAACPQARAIEATISLRENAMPQGGLLLLGDVADVSASDAFARDTLISVPLMPAPPAGLVERLSADEVRQLLGARGIETSRLRFIGAARVAIGRDASQAAEAAMEYNAVSALDVAAMLQDRIEADLSERAGHDRWHIELLSARAVLRRIGQITGPLDVIGPKKPRAGRLMYRVGPVGGEQSEMVFAQATAVYTAVVAARSIRQGDLIRQSDVRLEEIDRRPSSHTLKSVADAVGMEAKRSYSEGTMISQSGLRAPLLVRRGETVPVFARAAGLVVRTTGIAQQDGSLGELVQVKTADGGEAFAARVAGYRRLEVFAGGARADEYATLRSNGGVTR